MQRYYLVYQSNTGIWRGEGRTKDDMPLIFNSAQLFQKKKKGVKKVFSCRLDLWKWCTKFRQVTIIGFLLITTRDQVSEFASYLDSYLCLKNARHGLRGRAKVTYSQARCNHSIDAKACIAMCCFHIMRSQKLYPLVLLQRLQLHRFWLSSLTCGCLSGAQLLLSQYRTEYSPLSTRCRLQD